MVRVERVERVVCQVKADAAQMTFTWSDGTGQFSPFSFKGGYLRQLQECALACRECLTRMVQDYLARTNAKDDAGRQEYEVVLRKSCFLLAEAGYKLHQRLFKPEEDTIPKKQVQPWLKKLRDRSAVESLEVVIDGNPSIPWNVIYDQPPSEKAFLTEADTALERWRPFWGIRYNLAAGRKVDPLRRMPAPVQPTVLLVVDPETRRGLPEDQQQRLLEFTRKHGLPPPVESRDQLAEALAESRPDVLYWLSHGEPTALRLDGESVSPQQLFEMLESSVSDDPERFPGLVFLNACQTAEAPADPAAGSFLDRLFEVRVSGVIATEQQTIDTFANPLGLDFLEAFLDRGEPVGQVLQQLRGRVPLGLLYATYCPPHLRKAPPPGAATELPITYGPATAGIALGGQLRTTAPPPPLPATPLPVAKLVRRRRPRPVCGAQG
jgi:hypothetical protein